MDKEKQNNNGVDLSKSFGAPDKKFQKETRVPQDYFLPGTPKIIQWVIRYSGGLVKDEKQANYVLIGLVALAIIISLFLFFGGGNNTAGEVPVNQFVPH